MVKYFVCIQYILINLFNYKMKSVMPLVSNVVVNVLWLKVKQNFVSNFFWILLFPYKCTSVHTLPNDVYSFFFLPGSLNELDESQLQSSFRFLDSSLSVRVFIESVLRLALLSIPSLFSKSFLNSLEPFGGFYL